MADHAREKVEFLQRVPLFAGLNKRHLETLSRRVVVRTYAPGEAIVTQGLGGEGMFVVVSGRADAVRERNDGNKVVVNRFAATDFFGELALLDEGLRTASVIAQEPTTCLVLTRWDFLAEVRQDADMAVLILQELARRFRQALDAM